MNSHDRILSLLGLSLRGGNLVVGEEPVDAAARAKDARLLLLAADSADNTRRRCEHMALAGNCLWVRLPCTKEQLGRALGRTSVALAAVTDIGLASALTKLLEEQDPAQYGDTAARIAEKARRAAERKAEQAAHEKNLRRGRRKPPVSPPEPERSAPAPAGPDRRSSGPRSAQQQATDRRSSGPRSAQRQATDRRSSGPRSAQRQATDRRFSQSRPPDRPLGEGSSSGPSAFGSGPWKRAGASAPQRNSRPSRDKRPKPKGQARPYANSRPVKKGKGSFRKKEG